MTGDNQKTLLVVVNTPSPNTQRLADAVLRGAREKSTSHIEAVFRRPLEAIEEDVIAADGIIIGTTENFGYMSGLIKDFFERVYYPCLELKQGLPCCLYIRAGLDGQGTQVAVEKILTGLRWRLVQEPIILHGDWKEEFIAQCEELGLAMAVGLDAGVF